MIHFSIKECELHTPLSEHNRVPTVAMFLAGVAACQGQRESCREAARLVGASVIVTAFTLFGTGWLRNLISVDMPMAVFQFHCLIYAWYVMRSAGRAASNSHFAWFVLPSLFAAQREFWVVSTTGLDPRSSRIAVIANSQYRVIKNKSNQLIFFFFKKRGKGAGKKEAFGRSEGALYPYSYFIFNAKCCDTPSG